MHLGAAEVEPVARLHRDEPIAGDELADVRDERRGHDDAHVGERWTTRQEREIQMVEMLVRDEQPVDVLGRERPRRRRDEPQLVRAGPRVDDDAYALDLEPEPRLAEPGGAPSPADLSAAKSTMI